MKEIGRITSVEVAGDGRIYVSVKTSPSLEHRDVLWATAKTGLWSVPSEGDIVEVYELGVEDYIARSPHTVPEIVPPTLEEGDFCLAINSNTRIWFSQQADGTVNVELQADGDVSVKTSNGGNVDVASDGNVSVDGSNITLGSGAAEALAKQSHSHDVTLSDGSTATTGQPNEPGTEKTSAE